MENRLSDLEFIKKEPEECYEISNNVGSTWSDAVRECAYESTVFQNSEHSTKYESTDRFNVFPHSQYSTASDIESRETFSSINAWKSEADTTQMFASVIDNRHKTFSRNECKSDIESTRVGKCPICEKVISRKYDLAKHMRVHTGDKPYTCDLCGAVFSSSSNLTSHYRSLHSGQRPYTCPVCHKGFVWNSHLRFHMKQH
jgi:uncharacterized Zn-finger protein